MYEKNYKWIDSIMEQVALNNDLKFELDVRRLTVGTVQNFYEYLSANPNTTLYSIVWCTTTWQVSPDSNFSIPCTFD